MPAKIELRVGDVVRVAGVPVTLAYTCGHVAVICAAEFDDEGTADPNSSLLSAASSWRRRFDRRSELGKDGSNSRSV